MIYSIAKGTRVDAIVNNGAQAQDIRLRSIRQ